MAHRAAPRQERRALRWLIRQLYQELVGVIEAGRRVRVGVHDLHAPRSEGENALHENARLLLVLELPEGVPPVEAFGKPVEGIQGALIAPESDATLVNVGHDEW